MGTSENFSGSVKITIIEQLEPNKVIIKCALCEGSGHRPGYARDVECKVCTGKGVVLVECDPPLVKCALCDGSGHRSGYDRDVACNKCKGVGAQPLTGSMEILR